MGLERALDLSLWCAPLLSLWLPFLVTSPSRALRFPTRRPVTHSVGFAMWMFYSDRLRPIRCDRTCSMMQTPVPCTPRTARERYELGRRLDEAIAGRRQPIYS